MSKSSEGINNIKHKSTADKKNASLAGAVKKLGGQLESDEVLVHWENHRRAENLSERRKRESDGFLRGVIISHNLWHSSRLVATSLIASKILILITLYPRRGQMITLLVLEIKNLSVCS